jgi:hypothetical protein
MTPDDLMRVINRYTEACDDLGAGLFEQTAAETQAKHDTARALHTMILDEVYRLHAAAQPAAGGEPATKPMTRERAAYFMERFRREEKLLGPNEQAAVAFVIAMLEAPEQQPAPARYGAVMLNGALVMCERFDREPCPHQPERRCADCPGRATTGSAS